MIDMGHALPPALKQRMVARAREINSDFALWAEDFQLRPRSRAEGYNVCLGPFMQTVRDRQQLASWLQELHQTGVPVPFMATPENHNTPRAVTWSGGASYVRYVMTIGAFLPGVPYVHGGLELAETQPINTGFDFTQEQLAKLPPEVLPLFSAVAYGWTREPNLVAELRAITALRACHVDVVTDSLGASLNPVRSSNAKVIAFIRGLPAGHRGLPAGHKILIVANSDMAAPQAADIELAAQQSVIEDMIGGQRFAIADGALDLLLSPAEVLVCEL